MSSSRQRFSKFRDRFLKGDDVGQFDDKSELDNFADQPGKHDSHDNEVRRERRKSYLRSYISRLWPHWPLVAWLTLLAVVVSALEIVQPLFARYLFDDVLLTDLPDDEKFWRVQWVCGLFLVLTLVVRVLSFTRMRWQEVLNNRVVISLRHSLFDHLMRLSLDRLSEMKVGGIISRLTDDINRTLGLMQMAVISPGVALLRLTLAAIILLMINWKLALTSLVIIPPIMYLSMLAITRIRPIYRAIRKDVNFVDGRVGETFSGIRDVRAFAGEHRETSAYVMGNNLVTRKRMFANGREVMVWSTWGLIIGLTQVAILWAGSRWYLMGQATIGDITAFQVYVLLLLNPVWQIVESLTELQRSLAAMERVFEVLDMPLDKPDRPNARLAPQSVERIEFRNLGFSYNEGRPVLQQICLDVRGGETIALVGRSGAGKTTLTDLVSRFYDPTEGSICLNGIDLRDIKLTEFRKLLGVVQQEVFLFDGSVRENLAYGRKDASEENIVMAAKQANAHEFITELVDGYESLIGERGVKLSGGQRQRLSIARAILADPQILILDEATSNLDSESEQLIQESLARLMVGRTTFVIAHRLSTITHADQIVVMDAGRVIETGTHETLLMRDGHYADMIQRQQNAVAIL